MVNRMSNFDESKHARGGHADNPGKFTAKPTPEPSREATDRNRHVADRLANEETPEEHLRRTLVPASETQEKAKEALAAGKGEENGPDEKLVYSILTLRNKEHGSFWSGDEIVDDPTEQIFESRTDAFKACKELVGKDDVVQTAYVTYGSRDPERASIFLNFDHVEDAKRRAERNS